MSKYIKLEDAISKIVNTPTKVITDLPTIEVSDEVLKATMNFNVYTIADENADMGMRTEIEPIIEVSEDCISKEWLKENMLKYGFTAPDMTVTEFVEDAPSVVPSRAEGEWVVSEDGDSLCSICGASEEEFIFGTENWYGLGESKFCPSCGAKMKGADDE